MFLPYAMCAHFPTCPTYQPYLMMFFPRSVSATVPKGEEVAKEAAGAVGGGDEENPGS